MVAPVIIQVIFVTAQLSEVMGKAIVAEALQVFIVVFKVISEGHAIEGEITSLTTTV